MTALGQHFENYIRRQKLFGPNDRLLLAVSGGLDSMVLAHLIRASGHTFAIAHCDFQLRQLASDQDSAFVQSYAKLNGISCYHKKFETQAYAKQQKLSTQLAARELRYDWFSELMKDKGFDYLLTAHHANDQLETMLYNLTKGTGVAGLRGIPVKIENIRRPLLFATREEIEQYAMQHNIEWREDSSNQDDKYRRNLIRHRVVPPLKEINPALERTLLNTSRRFDALEKLLLVECKRIKAKYMIKNLDNELLSLSWYEESKGGLAILTELLKGYGFNSNQCASISDAIDTQSSGKQFFSSQYVLGIDRESLIILPNDDQPIVDLVINEQDEELSTAVANFTFEKTETTDGWTKNRNEAYLDADKIEFPLKLRNWQQGDVFHPLGMKGKKKLSDFMIDEKIPVNLKSRVLVFESNQDIIWIAGHRIDDRFKITPKTKHVLIIKMTDHV
ncbi:MAG: tRNA lysidine(34) synthetase TilS [Reichenbachiella sp.]|uniref:tRNA lysidine(34) synthetase TilS n=1 Tax=Reichenbachiella sp. TaxID=2184521 RepID=UPI003264F69D